jgi:hypothetical protein
MKKILPKNNYDVCSITSYLAVILISLNKLDDAQQILMEDIENRLLTRDKHDPEIYF